MKFHIERVLFVVAPQDSGKSTTLRSMFCDRRFGTAGRIPDSDEQRRLPATHFLGHDRRLYLRLTSPHEVGETPKEFLQKVKDNMDYGRWCFAAPLQPNAFKRMPNVVQTVRLFIDAFQPERVRVAILSPNRHEVKMEDYFDSKEDSLDAVSELLSIPTVEVMIIDGRIRGSNGLLLADFFDFT